VRSSTPTRIDDALALLLAWGSPEWTVEVVTVVAATLRWSAAPATSSGCSTCAGRCPRPSWRPARHGHWHGRYGPPRTTAATGSATCPDWPPVEPRVASVDAPGVIVEAATRYGGGLTIVALGPLTNLALAVERDARRSAAPARGGDGRRVDVPGNVTPDAEFNAHVDPRRSRGSSTPACGSTSFRSTPRAGDAGARRAASRRSHARRRRSPTACAASSSTRYEWTWRTAGAAMDLHDPLASAFALDPTLVRWSRSVSTVGPDGQTRRAAGEPNARFAHVVDTPRFLSMFLERLCPRASRGLGQRRFHGRPGAAARARRDRHRGHAARRARWQGPTRRWRRAGWAPRCG